MVRIFHEFSGVRGEPGEIKSVQSYEQYDAVLSLAADMAQGLRGDPLASEVGGRYDPLTTRDIPLLSWSGKGDGQTCELFGRTLTARCEDRSGRKVWVLDVDSETACAFEPTLERITSEVAVADAIFEYRRRTNVTD